MRNKRKTFRLIVMMTMALVLTAGSAVTSSAASFSDVPDNAWYKADLDEMVQTGLVRGYSDGTFKPNKEVTFSEFTMFLERARGNMDVEHLYNPKKCFRYLALDNNIMSVFDVAYYTGMKHGDPETNYYEIITTKTSRKLAAQILFGYYADGYYDWDNFDIKFKDFDECILWSANQDYRNQVAFCNVTGFLKGMSASRFSPGTNITRAQAITIVKRIYDHEYSLDDYYVKGEQKHQKPDNAYFPLEKSE